MRRRDRGMRRRDGGMRRDGEMRRKDEEKEGRRCEMSWRREPLPDCALLCQTLSVEQRWAANQNVPQSLNTNEEESQVPQPRQPNVLSRSETPQDTHAR